MKIRLVIVLILVFSLLSLFYGITIGTESRSKLAFSVWDDGDWGIFIMYPDGSGLTRLTSTEYNSFAPSWSPDGSRIVYAVEGGDLYIMDANGENIVNVTNTANYGEIFPAWSPDGEEFAYMASKDTESLDFEIFVASINGTNPTKLTNSGGFNGFPEWSPDGRQIAFVTDRNGSFDLFLVNSDGSEERYITTLTKNMEADEALALSWSPDGTQIAFTSDRGGNFDIYAIDLSNNQTINLTKQNNSVEAFPAWSADGSKIAFLSYQDDQASIYVMNNDGSCKECIFTGVNDVRLLKWSNVLY